MQARRPAEPVDVGIGKAEGACEGVDVAGHADRVPVRVRVALVDDVREGLERVQGLVTGAPYPRVRLVDGERDRDDGEDVPRMVQREERQHRAEPGLRRRGAEIRLQRLAAADELEETPGDDEVHESKGRERNKVVGERQASAMAAADGERIAGRERGERERRRLERS